MITNFDSPGRGYDERYDGGERQMRGRRFEQPGYGQMRSREEEQQGAPMVKVIEVLAQSPYSWEDATRRAIMEASRTIRGIRSIYIKDMQAVVEDDQVVSFRINAKISFALDHRGHPRQGYQESRRT